MIETKQSQTISAWPQLASKSVEERLQHERHFLTSQKFLLKHPEYFNCAENNAALAAEVDRLDQGTKCWRAADLETAFTNLQQKLIQRGKEPEQDNLGYTPLVIQKMSGREMIEARKDPDHRAAIDRVIAKSQRSK